MAVKRVYGSQNVLEAARTRIKNVFSNGVPVFMAFSCGKDSLCMSNIVYEMIRGAEINPRQLTVIFIDEEGLYRSMLEAAYRWRERFISVGAKFVWYCLPVKQASIIDHLSASESWITWDPKAKETWMRQPPPFAVTSHPLVKYPGECNYQTFCERLTRNGIQIIGLRAAESLQRLQLIAGIKNEIRNIYPIYDWTDNDVWYYIKERNLEFPEIYIRLYECGVSKPRLRLCNFFGDSSIAGLKYVAEADPELWAAIERRYPNAYLVLLYWDSEMFKRSTRKRRALEEGQDKDYKALVHDILFLHTERYTIPSETKAAIASWRRMVKDFDFYMDNSDYKDVYEKFMAGDPKKRSYRALYTNLYEKRASMSEKEEAKRRGK